MPTAKKQPSGKWKVRVYDYTDEAGKQHMKSFTATTKKEAERLAAQYSHNRSECPQMTLAEAIDKYITDRSEVLSPATIRSYRVSSNSQAQSIMGINIDRLTNASIQRAINKDAASVSPKTIRNAYGLIGVVLHTFRPEFRMDVKYPAKVRPKLSVPEDDQIKALLDEIAGTPLELPVLLAAFGPMRRGEIAALRYENISGDIVHVCENMVITPDNTWMVKTTKTYSGDRYIQFPDFVARHFTGRSGRVTELNPRQITEKFNQVKKKIGLNCRFHDLRHYCASYLHTIMPDQYIMQRGGWSTDATLKSVYRHALSDQAAKFNAEANAAFERTFNKS